VPTLVLSGEGDELVPPANGVQLARLLPECRLHILEGEGHLMVFDPESASLPLLEDFFSSPVPSAAWTTGTSVDDDATVERGVRAVGERAAAPRAERRVPVLRRALPAKRQRRNGRLEA
jgi:hypothetical protein